MKLNENVGRDVPKKIKQGGGIRSKKYGRVFGFFSQYNL